MLIKNFFHKYKLWILIVFNLIVRLLISITTNLGNDEAYYFTYGLTPDISYYDHPPMIGFLILLTTFGLEFTGEFFMRLGPLVFGTLNIIIIYKIGKEILNEKAGFISALMASSSLYSTIIAGTFIMPDTPLSFFWLLSLYMAVCVVRYNRNKDLILFGLFSGLAMISKYQASLLWFGLFLYFLFYKREYFKRTSLYISLILTAVIFSPVIIWNIENGFYSFSFHSSRIGESSINMLWVIREIAGQFGYNNPINFVIIVVAMFPIFKKRLIKNNEELKVIFLTSFPLIILSIILSFTSQTLPHWSGPAYYGLILLASYYIASEESDIQRKFKSWIAGANVLMFIIVLLGIIHINKGIINSTDNSDIEQLGRNDFSLDMYGWDLAGEKINEWVNDQDFNENRPAFVSRFWYPANHFTYYFSFPYKYDFWVYGYENEQHHFMKCNEKLNPVRIGQDMVYITSSTSFKPLPEEFKLLFESVDESVVIPIYRDDKTVYNLFLYRLRKAIKEIKSEDMMPVDIKK